MDYKTIKIGPFKTSKIELLDLLKAWAAISLVFSIVIVKRVYGGLTFDMNMVWFFLLSGVTVGFGFLLHEMAHKIVAQRYGCFAEFRASNQMLVLAFFLALISGWVFAAPGAVMIAGHITRKENGIISLSGPLTNLILALIFLVLTIITNLNFLFYGFMINSWLAFFNMIPVWNLDGKKIFAWNKGIYFFILGISILLAFSDFFLGLFL